MAEFKLDGIVPIVPTPFESGGEIDWKALKELVQFAIDARVCAICLPAYASEFYKLRDRERVEMVRHAIRFSEGRIPVIAQVNHCSAPFVVETAREMEEMGAAAVSIAVPRVFPLPEHDLLRYFDRILCAISIPLAIQDFNPGGSTVSVEFVKSLNKQHPHFQYLKLEEPLMSARVEAILDATGGGVGVVDGWGGIYMLELMEAGICGVMPGLAVCDILQAVWKRGRSGDQEGAYQLFQGVLPQIAYSLQNLEFFHHAEKALLVARGVLKDCEVRDATLTVSRNDRAHIEFLNRKIVELIYENKIGIGGPLL